jgi:uridylate kinase
VLLKLSGEAVEGADGPLNRETIERIAREIVSITKAGTRVGVVIGGGNIVRGRTMERLGFDRVRSDSVGMLATVINSLVLAEAIRGAGGSCAVQSALPVSTVVEEIDLLKTEEYLERGKTVLFAGGTGNPYFTTDTAAALRACEIKAEVLLKATRVDGVFDKDPLEHSDARIYKELGYDQVIEEKLQVMDLTAVTMCRENGIPIVVFNLFQEGSLAAAARGEEIGTRVQDAKEV